MQRSVLFYPLFCLFFYRSLTKRIDSWRREPWRSYQEIGSHARSDRCCERFVSELAGNDQWFGTGSVHFLPLTHVEGVWVSGTGKLPDCVTWRSWQHDRGIVDNSSSEKSHMMTYGPRQKRYRKFSFINAFTVTWCPVDYLIVVQISI